MTDPKLFCMIERRETDYVHKPEVQEFAGVATVKLFASDKRRKQRARQDQAEVKNRDKRLAKRYRILKMHGRFLLYELSGSIQLAKPRFAPILQTPRIDERRGLMPRRSHCKTFTHSGNSGIFNDVLVGVFPMRGHSNAYTSL